MLTGADEYFTHQVALPHAVVGSSDPAWRERYWFSFQDTIGKDSVVTCGLGKYPNQDVLEGFVSVAHRGVQRNIRLSRSLAADDARMRVGPFLVEVLEPLRALRLALDDNDSGMQMDVTWNATMEPTLEDRHFEITRSRVTHDLIRYVQHGRVSGRLVLPAEEVNLDASAWWGERDHSWGLRPLPPVAGSPPGRRPHWRFIMFCPIQFDDFALHIYLYEAEAGQPLHLSAAMSRPVGSAAESQAIRAIDHELEWDADAPIATLSGGRLVVSLADGKEMTVELRAHPGRAFLKGGGYQLDQGMWKGDLAIVSDEVDLSDPAVLRDYAAGSSDHLVEARCGAQIGFGVMEYVVRRGYDKYGEAQRR